MRRYNRSPRFPGGLNVRFRHIHHVAASRNCRAGGYRRSHWSPAVSAGADGRAAANDVPRHAADAAGWLADPESRSPAVAVYAVDARLEGSETLHGSLPRVDADRDLIDAAAHVHERQERNLAAMDA